MPTIADKIGKDAQKAVEAPKEQKSAGAPKEQQKGAMQRFDLRDMFPSSTVRIDTASSTYWVTRTHRQRQVRRGDRPALVKGVSVQTTSKHNRGIFCAGPDDTFVGAVVKVGETFPIGKDGRKTSKVTAITMTHS